MNYPLWDLPAAGLLIAFVAILHVFVSHFAVGGGLFLVLTERKARRENDDALLGFVRQHSRFFVLLTLVFGAISGVGIWFTIGLVHPAATSALITAFVWGWAIEWTFFVTEIAAAIVYYYGWDRLTAKQHMIVGWIYFWSAYLSLVVINGILTFMLTPGRWIENHAFWSGFFNPTYWPSVAIRTLAAVGLAGVYALFTSTWVAAPEIREKLARYAAVKWVLPMAIGLPFALIWYFAAADAAGVPVAETFATKSAGVGDLLGAVFTTALPASGHPVALRALKTAFFSITLTFLIVFTLLLLRKARFGRVSTALVMVTALFSIGGSEWAREVLRKPYVIGSYMFVNGLRVPPPAGSLAERQAIDDPLRIDRVSQAGMLGAVQWVRVSDAARSAEEPTTAQEAEMGRELFRVECSVCHTVDGYLAIRPLIRAQSSKALEGVISRLAVPKGAGANASWSQPRLQLVSWRNRHMPPFAGSDEDRRALAVYLAQLGGGTIAPRSASIVHSEEGQLGVSGPAVFDNNCAMCHASDSDYPIAPRVKGKSETQLYDMIGRLPEVNGAMPAFEGTDAERRALAEYLENIGEAQK